MRLNILSQRSIDLKNFTNIFEVARCYFQSAQKLYNTIDEGLLINQKSHGAFTTYLPPMILG
jgi:hypothetical protein